MSARLFPGRLRHRLTLQQPSLSADGAGGYTRSWADVAALWAEIQPFTARDVSGERLQGERLQSRVSHRIRLRYRAGVTAEMRLTDGTRIFNIRAVTVPQEAKEMLEILAEEGVGSV